MTELKLEGQTWEFQDDGSLLDTREVFARLIAQEIDRERVCRDQSDSKWRPVDLRFHVIGKYGVLKELGEGAFGKVYLGFDASRRDGKTGRLVALKRPSEGLLDRYAQAAGRKADTRLSDTENKLAARSWAKLQIGQAFSKEAILTARLAMAKNVVSVIDHDVTVPFVALEFCNGGDLTGRLQKPYELAQVIRWGIEIAAALESAHGLQPDALIHRDLKPDNILLDGETIKISDFGTSQMMQETQSLRSLKGGFTPLYAAPEAFDEKAYPATDIWSLGVMLYEMISGKRPFEGGSLIKLARKIDGEEHTPLEKLGGLPASPELIALVNECLRKDPSERPAASACRQRLEAMAAAAPPAASPGPAVARVPPEVVKQEISQTAKTELGPELAPPPPSSPPGEQEPGEKRGLGPVLAGLLLLGLGAGAVFTRSYWLPASVSGQAAASSASPAVGAVTSQSGGAIAEPPPRPKARAVTREQIKELLAEGEAAYGRGDDQSALPKFREASARGDPVAMRYLGKMFSAGRGVEQDEARAAEWYRKAADKGDASAMFNLGLAYRKGLGVKPDDAEAFGWYRKAAEKGYLSAMVNLGVMYENGQSVEKDDAKAVEWYRKAADKGYLSAMVNLGIAYENGQSVEKDDAKAVEWYRKAADKGDAKAMYYIGLAYANGLGVTKDAALAVEWYRKAAEKGHASATLNLGKAYRYGRGVEKDDAKAVEWYRKAAEKGNAAAMAYLGFMYRGGLGVKQDHAKAVEWYRKAAEKGYLSAMVNLGVMYENGRGVKKDDAKAVEWYRKAAEKGDAKAMYYLGLAYR